MTDTTATPFDVLFEVLGIVSLLDGLHSGSNVHVGIDIVEGADAIRGYGTDDHAQKCSIYATDAQGVLILQDKFWVPMDPGTDDDETDSTFDVWYTALVEALDAELAARGLPATDAKGGYRCETESLMWP